MTTTISKPGKRSHLRTTPRSWKAGYSGRKRNQKPPLNEEIRPRSIAHAINGAIGEEPKAVSPAAVFVSGAKTILPVLLALIPFGVAFGATAVGSGLSAFEALAMSVFVFAGAAQLAAIPLLSAGTSVAIVVLTVLIVNLRLTLYSASLASHFRRLPLRWKGLLSYLLTDQAYAATITRFDDGETKEANKRWYFLGVALAIWIAWQAA